MGTWCAKDPRDEQMIQHVDHIAGENNYMRHLLMTRLVLGDDWFVAALNGGRWRHVPLTVETMRLMADSARLEADS